MAVAADGAQVVCVPRRYGCAAVHSVQVAAVTCAVRTEPEPLVLAASV